MSAVPSRRNGKQASCEPCRKGKIRCDHQRPTCGRCSRKGLTSQCFYHPAPLTRLRGVHTGDACPEIYDSPKERHIPTPVAQHRTAVPFIAEGRQRNRDTGKVSHTYGFPWPSYPLPAGKEPAEGQRSLFWGIPRAIEDDDAERLQKIKEVLLLLRHFRFMQTLISEYAIHSQASLVPQPIALSFMDSLADLVTTYAAMDDANGNDDGFRQMAQSVFRSTCIPAETPADLAGFLATYSGEKIRLETIGLLFTITATACLLGLARDDEKHTDLVQAMYRASTTCMAIVRAISHEVNDVMLWLSFENLRLATHMEGDSSPIVWRKLGNVVTDIFAAGYHREAKNTSKTPFFLAECRRKTFVAAYQLDKFIATLLDLPPRMLRRYSDCKMPLDLTDEQLLSESEELERARACLTPDGWNSEAKYIPSSWQRVRFMLGMVREDILEYPFLPSTPENNAKLKDLARRCNETYNSLPTHLQYNPEQWNTIPPNACLMSCVMRLNYLASCFQIQRLLEDTDPDAWHALLRASAETIAIILQIGNCLNKAIFLRHDFPYIVLAYGLPCAVILAYALQASCRGREGATLAPDLSRPTLIRHLSVFVSHLESICDASQRNHTICTQASKAITRALDEVLDAPATPAVTTTPAVGPQTPMSSNESGNPTSDLLGSSATQAVPPDVSMDVDLFNGDLLDGFDLSSWVKNIDWTGTGGEWSTF